MAGQTYTYANVERFRLTVNGTEIEDVTSITLPDVEHPTTAISTAGMAGELELPDTAFVNAMTFSVTHNKGKGAEALLASRATIIVSIARMRYDTAGQEVGYVNTTYKLIGMHKKTTEGRVETKNPLSVTDDFSISRFEERVEGKERVFIDVTSGTVREAGENRTSAVESALNEQ